MYFRDTVYFFLISMVLVVIKSEHAFAQTQYSAQDSVEIYDLLNAADQADLRGKMNTAFSLVDRAMKKSRQKNFLRGQAFSWLKLADLKLKSESSFSLDQYYDQASKIADRLTDHFLHGLIEIQRAQQKGRSGDYEAAEKHCLSALKYLEQTDSINYRAYTYNELGFILEKSGRYEEATQYNLIAIKLFEKSGNISESANTLGNQAVIYYKLGRKEDALRLFKQSAKVRNSIGDIKGLAATYGNIATVYMPINEDSADKYYSLQLLNAQKSGIQANIGQAYTNNIALKRKQSKFSEALEFETKAIRLFSEMGDKEKLGMRYISAGGLYHKLDDSLKAEKHFAIAEQIGRALKSKPMLQELYLRKSQFYQERKDFARALEYIESYHIYKDSLINEKTATNIAELELKFETAEKDNEISRLRSASEIQRLELEHRQALLNGNQLEALKKEQAILLLKQDQKLKEEDIKLKEELLKRQALVVKNNEQQLKIADQEQQLKNQELQREKLIRQIIIATLLLAVVVVFILFGRYQLKRKLEEQKKILAIRDNISKDLHDEIGSTLTSINILSNISQQAFAKDPLQAKGFLQKISEQTKMIQQNMSDIVWALRPGNEAVENLEVRMREFAAQTLEADNIKTRFNFDHELHNQSFSHEVRKDLLLIYKEAVNNIIKHAQATVVEIALEREVQMIRLTIKDNGTGNQFSGNLSSGTGTKTMQQRAKAIGGNLTIDRKNDGTTVTLEVPLP